MTDLTTLRRILLRRLLHRPVLLRRVPLQRALRRARQALRIPAPGVPVPATLALQRVPARPAPGRSAPRQRDRGGVMVLVTVLFGFGVLLPACALVVDVGSMYVELEQLQSGADSAATAVVTECVAGRCDLPTNMTMLMQRAKKYADANAKDGHTAIAELCGNWPGLPACSPARTENLTTCLGAPPSENYVEVRVRTEMPNGSTLLPPTLARSFVGMKDYDGTTVGACARATASDVCVSASKATYTHTFDGAAGKATITADRPLCPGETQSFTLMSYTAPSASFSVPQYLYDHETKSITSDVRSLSFSIDVPACYTQVDFIFGSKVYNPLTGIMYGDTKVGSAGAPGNRSVGPQAWYNGGSTMCRPKPAVTFTARCDKSLDLTLSNGSTANIDAAFIVTAANGDTRWIRVARGKATKLSIKDPGSAKVTVEDNTGATGTGTWSKPATCG